MDTLLTITAVQLVLMGSHTILIVVAVAGAVGLRASVAALGMVSNVIVEEFVTL